MDLKASHKRYIIFFAMLFYLPILLDSLIQLKIDYLSMTWGNLSDYKCMKQSEVARDSLDTLPCNLEELDVCKIMQSLYRAHTFEHVSSKKRLSPLMNVTISKL